MTEADDLIAHLRLEPHPEGGHYRETYRSIAESGARASCTTIHYLLRAHESSHWHRVDADEVWCFHAGDPLELRIHAGGKTSTHRMTADPRDGEPQVVVPAGAWQAARPLGDYALVSCIVAPGFDFAGFEMAPPDWEPS